MSDKFTNGKRKKAIRTCRCMISFAIDSVGAAGDVCAGDGLVGEGGRAMSGRVLAKWTVSEHVARMTEDVSKRGTYAPNNLFGNTGRWWWLDLPVTVVGGGEPMTFLWMGE